MTVRLLTTPISSQLAHCVIEQTMIVAVYTNKTRLPHSPKLFFLRADCLSDVYLAAEHIPNGAIIATHNCVNPK